MKKLIIILSLSLLLSCNRSKYIFPDNKIVYSKEYMCWPYSVNVYDVDSVKVDSLFLTYPRREFGYIWPKFDSDSKFYLVKWTAFDKLDKSITKSLIWDLDNADSPIAEELLKQIRFNTNMYFACTYTLITDRKSFHKIALYVPEKNEIHIFKYINYHL